MNLSASIGIAHFIREIASSGNDFSILKISTGSIPASFSFACSIIPTTKINLNRLLISFSGATDKPDDF